MKSGEKSDEKALSDEVGPFYQLEGEELPGVHLHGLMTLAERAFSKPFFRVIPDLLHLPLNACGLDDRSMNPGSARLEARAVCVSSFSTMSVRASRELSSAPSQRLAAHT